MRVARSVVRKEVGNDITLGLPVLSVITDSTGGVQAFVYIPLFESISMASRQAGSDARITIGLKFLPVPIIDGVELR